MNLLVRARGAFARLIVILVSLMAVVASFGWFGRTRIGGGCNLTRGHI